MSDMNLLQEDLVELFLILDMFIQCYTLLQYNKEINKFFKNKDKQS